MAAHTRVDRPLAANLKGIPTGITGIPWARAPGIAGRSSRLVRRTASRPVSAWRTRVTNTLAVSCPGARWTGHPRRLRWSGRRMGV